MMKRSMLPKILILLGISIALIANVALAAKSRLALADAKALVNKELFNNELKEVSLHEITTDDVWKRLGVQVYKEGFLIDNKKIVAVFDPACRSINMYTSDLDKNGSPELICFFTNGYRPTHYLISVYTNGKVLKLGSTMTDYVFHNAFSVEKLNDQKIQLAITVLNNGTLSEVKRLLSLRKEGSDLVVDAK